MLLNEAEGQMHEDADAAAKLSRNWETLEEQSEGIWGGTKAPKAVSEQVGPQFRQGTFLGFRLSPLAWSNPWQCKVEYYR